MFWATYQKCRFGDQSRHGACQEHTASSRHCRARGVREAKIHRNGSFAAQHLVQPGRSRNVSVRWQLREPKWNWRTDLAPLVTQKRSMHRHYRPYPSRHESFFRANSRCKRTEPPPHSCSARLLGNPNYSRRLPTEWSYVGRLWSEVDQRSLR